MANVINTRIQLKYDTLANWTTNNPLLLAGELAIVTVGNSHTDTTPDNGTHPVLFKVGPGNFNALPFASALAADVYSWAKESSIAYDVVETKTDKYTGNALTGVEWDSSLNNGKGGLKFTKGTQFATKAELEAALEAFGGDLDAITDTDTRYVFELVTTEGDAHKGQIKVTATTYTNGEAGAPAYSYFDVLTTDEVNAILANYYTKEEADARFAPIDVDTGVHSVLLTGGTNNGTLKLTVDGTPTDNIAVTGLGDAAYTTVSALNATAKGYADAVEAKLPTTADYGVLTVAKGDDTITIGGTAQNPTIAVTANKFDAYGAAGDALDEAKEYADDAAEAVLGTSADTAAANTVYGAKAAAKEAQDDATEALTKIDTFLGTITPDGSQDIIDTLTEINNYVGEHGEEFAALSEKVTKIENGTTATTAGDLTTALETEIKGYTVANAEKLGGQLPSYYATAADLDIVEAKPGLDKVGTVISITAGTNLTGGTITESGTIALADSIDLTKVTADEVETGKLSVDGGKVVIDADGTHMITYNGAGGEVASGYYGNGGLKLTGNASGYTVELDYDKLTMHNQMSSGKYVKVSSNELALASNVYSGMDGADYMLRVYEESNVAKLQLGGTTVTETELAQLNTLANTYKTKQDAKSGTLTGAEVLGSWSQDANGVMTVTARTLTPADIGASPDTHNHSIYELEEGSNTTATGAVEYLIFNCGSASTLID